MCWLLICRLLISSSIQNTILNSSISCNIYSKFRNVRVPKAFYAREGFRETATFTFNDEFNLEVLNIHYTHTPKYFSLLNRVHCYLMMLCNVCRERHKPTHPVGKYLEFRKITGNTKLFRIIEYLYQFSFSFSLSPFTVYLPVSLFLSRCLQCITSLLFNFDLLNLKHYLNAN